MNKTESCIYVGSLQDIPFKIGCAPPGAGWDDNRKFLTVSFDTDNWCNNGGRMV